MANTPVRHIRIPDNEWAALVAAAEKNGTTTAQVVRDLARDYTQDRPDKDDLPTQARNWREAVSAAGDARYNRNDLLAYLIAQPDGYPDSRRARWGAEHLTAIARALDGGEPKWHRIPTGTTGATDGGWYLTRPAVPLTGRAAPATTRYVMVLRDYKDWNIGVGDYHPGAPGAVTNYAQDDLSDEIVGLDDAKYAAADLTVTEMDEAS